MFLMARMMTLWPIVWVLHWACTSGSSEVLSTRSVNRPTAVDLIKIAVASGLKFIRLLVRQLAAFVFDNEDSLLNRRFREKAQTSAGTTDTESSLAGHITHVRRFAPGNQRGGDARRPPKRALGHLWERAFFTI
jgi:hypothetical protein